jgi:FkbM family methyltransferase
MPAQTAKSFKRILNGTQILERLAGLKQRRQSHSQFGEDVHVRSFYDRLAHDRNIIVDNGCIVDVGAFRPIVYSNSYWFYRQGWHTINIDPTPGSMRMFEKVRPRDTLLEVGVSPTDGSAPFYLFGSPSVWNTMDVESARSAQKITGITPRKIQIQSYRLETILDKYLNGRAFEILSIDAEGFDIEILASNNFAKYRPRLILTELHNVTVKQLAGHPVVSFLEEQNYHLYSWINPNLLFVREDSLLEEVRDNPKAEAALELERAI